MFICVRVCTFCVRACGGAQAVVESCWGLGGERALCAACFSNAALVSATRESAPVAPSRARTRVHKMHASVFACAEGVVSSEVAPHRLVVDWPTGRVVDKVVTLSVAQRACSQALSAPARSQSVPEQRLKFAFRPEPDPVSGGYTHKVLLPRAHAL